MFWLPIEMSCCEGKVDEKLKGLWSRMPFGSRPRTAGAGGEEALRLPLCRLPSQIYYAIGDQAQL